MPATVAGAGHLQLAQVLTRRWFGVGLVAVAVAGLAVRVLGLWPPARSVMQAPYDDEGVYAMAAQLLWQGHLPYRDYFFAHPPLGVVVIAPALALNYTEWGSALSFGTARLLVAILGAATVVVVGLAAGRIWGAAGGLVAALALAFDPASVANSRHVLLETPMALLAAGALLAGTWRSRRAGVLCGLLAGLAALTKVQAAGLVVALLVAPLTHRQGQRALTVGAGALAATFILAPFVILAGPDQVLRQVGLFQIMRPADGLTATSERLAAIAAPTALGISLAGALIGLAVAWRLGRTRSTDAWRPAALWVLLGLAGFFLSRSYYPHYASQLAPGLAILTGGLGTALAERGVGRGARLLAAGGVVALLVAGGWQTVGAIAPRPDPMFVTVGRYLSDAVPPGQAALATDAQFNLLASRPLPRVRGWFLVDSYGHLTYTGLGLDQGPLLDAARATVARRDAATVDEITWRPAAQALLREHLTAADVVVVHEVGRRRLTPATRTWLAERYRLVEVTRRYDIFRRGS